MTGEVEREDRKTAFHWKLQFSSLCDPKNSWNSCPEFRFGGRRWRMDLYLSRENRILSGYTTLYLDVRDSLPAIHVRYSVGIRTAEGGTEVFTIGGKTFGPHCHPADVPIIARSELVRRSKELLPQGTLTLTVTLELEDGSSETDLPENQCVKDSDLESLSGDISQLLESEIDPDLKLRCGDRTISAHRSILAARSPVFRAMFQNKMAESETGIVDVTDVESEVLHLLLRYVYSGKVPDMSYDTASSLYEASEKYSIHALKKSCLDFMVRNLTTENCLGCLVVADARSDEEFRERAADFAAKNLESLKRDDWFEFNKDHPCLANSVYQRRLASAIAQQV